MGLFSAGGIAAFTELATQWQQGFACASFPPAVAGISRDVPPPKGSPPFTLLINQSINLPSLFHLSLGTAVPADPSCVEPGFIWVSTTRVQGSGAGPLSLPLTLTQISHLKLNSVPH